MKARIFNNNRLAGELKKLASGHYTFIYDDLYFKDSVAPPISLTLPKNTQKHSSTGMFPFFFNMLAEGVNLELQCRQHQIDPE